jgi:hypothetical protein
MSPKFSMTGYLRNKIDVYSFGVVVLELVSGWIITNNKCNKDFVYLVDWVSINTITCA